MPTAGSSPLTRGKHGRHGSCRGFAGLIPAHAGKTTRSWVTVADEGAHPRSRGENADSDVGVERGDGSSPLTRGKPDNRRLQVAGRGLIPAHAGKTDSGKRSWIISRAHPRSRGENSRSTLMPRSLTGSSPLTRGKLFVGIPGFLTLGLIPAHAGKTNTPTMMHVSERAHPRSRGENISSLFIDAAAKGSSPLTRGKPCTRRRRAGRQRLIPAHAGKTPTARSRASPPTAHPRSRGENSPRISATASCCGSSPLTRGKQTEIRPRLQALRLIPAHAGKTGGGRSREG